MDPEKENNQIIDEQEGFGKIVDVLHKKSKLPHLRTYQGDMAEFIKEKNESVISVSMKEKKRREEKEEQEKRAIQEALRQENLKKEEQELNEKIQKERQRTETPKQEVAQNIYQKAEPIPVYQKITETPSELANKITDNKNKQKKNSRGLHTSLIITVASILLIVAGVYAIFNVFGILVMNRNNVDITSQGEIIPYTNLITVSNITRENFRAQIEGMTIQNGINILKIVDIEGNQIKNTSDFFKFLGILAPGSLERDMLPDFAFGKSKRNEKISTFLVIQTKDFGRAFASLLDWENNMLRDFQFMQSEISNIQAQNLTWKDLIIRNKDTRALTNQTNEILLIYSFLDRNTILITTSAEAIEDINNSFLSRSFVR